MTHAAVAAVMTTNDGAPVALTGVAVRATVRDLLAEVTVEHRYRNDETAPIEAIYSFPLPAEAVLLDVRVRLGERELTGKVVGRAEAEQGYEAAVVDGDAAVMIERPEPGLYVMNLGNLLPRADARVTFRYALVLRRQRGRIRFLHPTTIAPRYGRWTLQPHQVPEASLLAQQSGTLEIEIVGALADARILSPSHDIEIEQGAGRSVVRLRRGRMDLDRDFVLDLDASALPGASTLGGADLEGGYACLVMAEPRLPAELEAVPRDLKVVVDCSGSMQGDSIAQARAAVRGILERLRPQDRFSVVLFGSSHRLLFPVMVAGDDATVAAAQRLLGDAIADMGGTEMGAALAAAYGISVREGATPTVILITDGEITDVTTVVEAARSSGHRLLTVGVGSAVAEGLLRDLAQATGGACELVAPRDDMAERIIRHVRRIDGGGATLAVQWPAPPLAVYDLDQPLFAGDMAAFFARFAQRPQGEALITATGPAGQHVEERVTLSAGEFDAGISTVTRLAAARELFALGIAIDSAPSSQQAELEQRARACAERYQLLSPWTNWLIMAAQANAQAGEIPAARKVPHMLAAGWGGSGMVLCDVPTQAGDADVAFSMSATAGAPASRLSRWQRHSTAAVPKVGMRPLAAPAETPMFSSRPADGSDGMTALIERLDFIAANRGGRLGRLLRSKPPAPEFSIDDLLKIDGIEPAVLADLRRLVAAGHDERTVVAAFLWLLIEGPFGKQFGRRGRLLVRQLHRELAPPPAVMEAVGLAAAGRLAVAG